MYAFYIYILLPIAPVTPGSPLTPGGPVTPRSPSLPGLPLGPSRPEQIIRILFINSKRNIYIYICA